MNSYRARGGVQRALLWALLVACAAACRPSAAPRFQRAVLATPVVRVPIALEKGESVELAAVASRGGARPVLHLWEPAAGKELAHAAAPVWRRSARLHYRNRGDARRLEILVRSDRAGATGLVDVLRDGKALVRATEFGGALLTLASGAGLSYLVAAAPAAPKTASLWGLDADGGIIAHTDTGGASGLPRLDGSAQIKGLLLAADAVNKAPFNVYANDADDRDGDGVGRRLERALGLCDSAQQKICRDSPLADYYRGVETGTRDTDRDGLSDGDELFGAVGVGLDLPRYGADPRHKDVLIEVDHDRKLSDVGFSERELRELAELFAAGSGDDLKNPDGQPGVRLHLDVGFSPSNLENAALFGDWGGSGRAQAAEYRAARKQDFSAGREGYFRYAFVTHHGRGQATKDAFTVNRDLQRVNIFAHELGHTLGLEHYGHDSWGKRNCKPSYYSIMNYLYQYRDEMGFSRGASHTLNPASVIERGAVRRSKDAALLSDSPLELDVSGRDVDWNRDGLISDVPVRANLLWATYKSCGAAESGLTTLASEHVGAATPVLLTRDQRPLALWLDDTGQLWLRRQQAQGDLVSWSVPMAVPELTGLKHIAGMAVDAERVALAYVLRDGSLNVALLSFGEGTAPHVLANTLIEGAATDHTPAIAWLELSPAHYGASQALSVLYRSASSGRIEQALAADAASVFVRRPALDSTDQEIYSARGPSLTVLPSGERCGVFPDPQSFVRFYCYDATTDRWRDLSAQAFDVGLGPTASDGSGLAYHIYRDSSGAALSNDGSRGALVLAFSEPKNNPHLYLSQWLNAEHGAGEQISFRWRGRVITEWTQLAPGTGVALHEGAEHLQALMVQRTGSGALQLDYLPYVDGERDQELSSGNDFQVMERGVCLGIRTKAACGGPDTGMF